MCGKTLRLLSRFALILLAEQHKRQCGDAIGALAPDSKLEIRRYNRQSVGPAGRPQTTIIYDETQEISTLQVSIDDQYPTQGHLIASVLGAAKPIARSYALNTM